MATAPTVKARKLRNNMTEPEVWLWARLKRLHAEGYHFRRQRPYRGYFLDFVCHDRMLVIELDGGYHNEALQTEHDGVRDAILSRAGFQVLRFANSAVRTNIDGVMETIRRALVDRPSARGQEPPPADAALERESPTRPALRAGHPPLKRRDV